MIVFIHYWFALVWNLGLWLSSQCRFGFSNNCPSVTHCSDSKVRMVKKCNAKWKVLWEQAHRDLRNKPPHDIAHPLPQNPFLASFWIGRYIGWPERFFGVVVQLYHAHTPTHKKILAFQMKQAKKQCQSCLKTARHKTVREHLEPPWASPRSSLRPKIQLFTRNAHRKTWKLK